MKRVFADTFYWIALTESTDAAHEHAHQVTDYLVTTDEVLAKYLTFCCGAPEFIRREAALTVADILEDPGVNSPPANPGVVSCWVEPLSQPSLVRSIRPLFKR